MSVESDGGMILTGENRGTRRKTCPSATLSTTNPTWIDPGANPGLRGERPATNDLSHGTALCFIATKKCVAMQHAGLVTFRTRDGNGGFFPFNRTSFPVRAKVQTIRFCSVQEMKLVFRQRDELQITRQSFCY
jgi:hypothetical protein